jgi:DNA polymerase/3'-5' exonuclease PolX
MNHSDAKRISDNLAFWLAPHCLRPPVVVGSIRRGKPDVKDCEILVYPNPAHPRPEFGQPVYLTALDKALAGMQAEGTLRRIKGAEVYRQYEIRTSIWGVQALTPFKLDLFIVTDPATWGVQMVIKTGPAEFSHWVVTSVTQGGALPYGYHFNEHNPWHVTGFEGQVRPMPEEKDFLDFLGLGWIEPADRQPKWSRDSHPEPQRSPEA